MPDLRKRKNILEVKCPICGHSFLPSDYKHPIKTYEGMFKEEASVGFYGGNVKEFTTAECCRLYYLYWKEPRVLKDIEPVDYEGFIAELGKKYSDVPKEKAEEPVKEEPVKEEPKEEVKPIGSMKFFELKKYIKDNYNKEFKKGTKSVDMRKWLEENA